MNAGTSIGASRARSRFATVLAAASATALLAVQTGPAAPRGVTDTPRVTWIRHLSGSDTWPTALVVDSGGSSYIVGNTKGTTFGKSSGNADAFVARYDSRGRLKWGRQSGLEGDDNFAGVAVVGAKSVYVTGRVSRDESSNSIRVLTMSACGKTLLDTRFGEGYGNTFGRGIAVDRMGYMRVAGSDNTDMASADVYKLAPSGRLVWHRQLPYSMHGDNYSTSANAVDVDQEGNAYVVGGDTSDRFCGFPAKLDPSGRELWHRDFRKTLGSDYIGVNSVRVRGSVYVVGSTAGGGKTGFVAALDTRGKLLWVRRLGGELDAVALDKRGGIYAAGYIGHGRPVGKADAVVVKFDPSGVLQWSKRLSLGADTRASGIGVDGAANVYVCGSTVPKAGTRRGFIVRMVP